MKYRAPPDSGSEDAAPKPQKSARPPLRSRPSSAANSAPKSPESKVMDDGDGDTESEDEPDSPRQTTGIPFAGPRRINLKENSGVYPPAASVPPPEAIKGSRSGQHNASATHRSTAPVSRQSSEEFVPRQYMPGTYHTRLKTVLEEEVPTPSATSPGLATTKTRNKRPLRADAANKRKAEHDERSAPNLRTQQRHDHGSISGAPLSSPIPQPTPTSIAQAKEIAASLAAKKRRKVRVAREEEALRQQASRDEYLEDLRQKTETQSNFTAAPMTGDAATAPPGERCGQRQPEQPDPRQTTNDPPLPNDQSNIGFSSSIPGEESGTSQHRGANTFPRAPPSPPKRSQQAKFRYSPYHGTAFPNPGANRQPSSTFNTQIPSDQANTRRRRTTPAGVGYDAGSKPDFGRTPKSFNGRRFSSSSEPSQQDAEEDTQTAGSQSHGHASSKNPRDSSPSRTSRKPQHSQLEAYNRQWARLRAATAPTELLGSLGLADFPWPCSVGKEPTADEVEKFFSLNFGKNRAERRNVLHRQLKMWHCDKFNAVQKFVRPEEWPSVQKRQREVINALTDLVTRRKTKPH